MVGADDNATAHLLDGLRSAQQELHGWNRVISRLDFRAVTRLNDSTLSIRCRRRRITRWKSPRR